MYICLALQIKKLLDTTCPGALHTAQFSQSVCRLCSHNDMSLLLAHSSFHSHYHTASKNTPKQYLLWPYN